MSATPRHRKRSLLDGDGLVVAALVAGALFIAVVAIFVITGPGVQL